MCTGVRGGEGNEMCFGRTIGSHRGYFCGLRLEKESVKKKATCSLYFLFFYIVWFWGGGWVVNLLLL